MKRGWALLGGVAAATLAFFLGKELGVAEGVARVGPMVSEAADAGYRQGFTDGLAKGKLLAPPASVCMNWWFGGENAKLRVQEVRKSLCTK